MFYRSINAVSSYVYCCISLDPGLVSQSFGLSHKRDSRDLGKLAGRKGTTPTLATAHGA